MASIQGVNVVVKLSTDGTNYLDLICEISSKFDFNRSTNSIRTKCDGGTTAKSLGAYDWNISASAVVDNAPTASQISYKSILSHAVAGTYLYIKYPSPGSGSSAGSDFCKQGRCYITQLSDENQVDGVSQFDVTFSGDGALDITP